MTASPALRSLAERLTAVGQELAARPKAFVPSPRQAVAFDLFEQVDELLYGGAAGGGKTAWACELAIRTAERWPGARILIVRRVFPSLNRTIIPALRARLAGRADWNENKHTWTFANGSVVELGSVASQREMLKYSGPEYLLIIVEEAGEFPEEIVSFLRTRLRTVIPGAKPRMAMTANPIGAGLLWMRRDFVAPPPVTISDDAMVTVPRLGSEPARWSDVKAQVSPTERVLVQPEQAWRAVPTARQPSPPARAMVPARIADNPHLAENDPDYVSRIRSHTDERVVAALEHGDFFAMDGVAGAKWSEVGIAATRVHQAPRLSEVVVSIDPSGGAEGDEVGIIAAGRDDAWPQPHLYVLADESGQYSAHQWPGVAIDLYDRLGADKIVAEVNFGGDMVPALIHAIRPDIPVEVVRASRGKDVRAEPVAQLWSIADDRGGPRGHMVGEHAQLEAELTTWVKGAGWSPGRLDALVWAGTYLIVGAPAVEATTNATILTSRRLGGRLAARR